MKDLFKISITLFLLFQGVLCLGQDANEVSDEGILEGEFVISKDLEIILPEKSRQFDKVVPVQEEDDANAKVQYNFKDFKAPVTDLQTKLRVLKIRTEEPASITNNYVSAGFGSYIAPILYAHLGTNPANNFNVGLDVDHYSAAYGPVDDRYSANSFTSIGLSGQKSSTNSILNGHLNYNRQGLYFYGYDTTPTDRDSVRQLFNRFDVGVDFVQLANDDLPVEFSGSVRYNLVKDKFEQKNNLFDIKLGGLYTIDEKLSAGLDLNLWFDNYSFDTVQTNRTVYQVMPQFVYKFDLMTLTAGLRVAGQSGIEDGESNLKLFPVAELNYVPGEKLKVGLLLDGKIMPNNFNSLTYENPYLHQNQKFKNTIKTIGLRGWAEGSLSSGLGATVGFDVSSLNNMVLYMNDSVAQERFNAVYDDGSSGKYSVFAGLSYLKKGQVSSELLFTYNSYAMDNYEEAWHRPQTELTWSTWYSLKSKIILTTDLIVLGGIKSYDFSNGETVKLKAAADLNLKIDYLMSDKFSVFAMFNNLLANKYEIYHHYPSRGLQLFVGVTGSF